MSINIKLEKFYFEQQELSTSEQENSILQTKTNKIVKKLKTLLPTIDTSEIWNCHYISYILHHSENIEDYKSAHEYAKKAVDMGSLVSKWLYAATLDRLLISQGKKQKFGTQFGKVGNTWELLPIDTSINDIKRIEYGVPPLREALSVFLEKYKKISN